MSKPRRVRELLEWAEGIENEVAGLEAKIVPVREELEAARERLDLVRRLLRLEERKTASSQTAKPAAMASRERVESEPALARPRSSPDIESHVRAVLEERAEPMHIKEIRRTLVERGIPLPGRGDEANIIVRLRRADDLFVRTGRGTYALREWGLPEVKPTKKTTRRRSKARRKKP